MKRSFRSNDWHFTPTAMSEALNKSGATTNPFMRREPKVMAVHADGRRTVVAIPA